MLSLRELGISFCLSLLLFISLFLLIKPKSIYKSADKNATVVIEYRRLNSQIYSRIVGSSRAENNNFSIPDILPLEIEQIIHPFVPETLEIKQSFNPESELDWMELPEPELIEDYNDLPPIDEQIFPVEQVLEGLDIYWDDGNTREIMYIPEWNKLIDREMDNKVQSVEIKFLLTQEGYVFDPKLDNQLFPDSTWESILLNWFSQLVFEPGKEGQGMITIQFTSHSI